MAKTKTDAVSEHSRIVAGSARVILPPKHIRMSDEDIPFFENVINEFARSEWTDHDLELAALLARTLCDMEREQYQLRLEGSITNTERGTPVPNPRKTIVQMHAGTVLSLRKSLGMDARARANPQDIAGKKKNQIKKQASPEDGLIAYPPVN